MKQAVAGMSLTGAQKENYYFSYLEYFPQQKRWFLKALHQVQDDPSGDSDQALQNWIKQYQLPHLVADFPLTKPPCLSCELDCPGLEACPVKATVHTRERMNRLLDEDEKKYQANPKAYERERLEQDQVEWGQDPFKKSPILSRPFKRKLKKGFIPYWHRPVDFYLWEQYFDIMLKLFNYTYDSYGHTQQRLIHRMSYLQKHLPSFLCFYESHPAVILLELLRHQVIAKNSVLNLNDLERGTEARLDILRDIEYSLEIFIFDQDLEVIVRSPKAFQSFLLTLAGRGLLLQKNRSFPPWLHPYDARFLIPCFADRS